MGDFISRSAFSLVELSIVLVILGILTGGILAGQSLIRASEMRSIVSDYNRYKSAIGSFKDKYFAIPGDMTNATAFWGVAGGTGSDTTCMTTQGSGTQTCNGDGNGNIDTTDGGASYGEYFRFWQQMANASLIEGTYSGVTGPNGGGNSIIGQNVPKTKFGNGGWSGGYMPYQDGTGAMFAGTPGNFLQVGAQTATGATGASFFKPEEVWNIDTKMDDGKPAYGMVQADNPNSTKNPNCTTSTNSALATYNLALSAISCRIYFMNQSW